MVDVELTEIADFLAGHAPFDALPGPVRHGLPARMTVRYHRRGTSLMAVGADSDDLYVVRSGAIEIRDADGDLVSRGGEGTTAGSTTLVGGNPSRFDVVAIEDTLVLLLPRAVFHELSRTHPDFADHFDAERADRLRMAVSSVATTPTGQAILRTSGRDLVHAPIVSVPMDATIHQTALVMTERDTSSVLVLDGQRVAGILTDRDLRRRVLAAGVDLQGPVSEVMTPDPVVAPAETPAVQLLMTMTERNVHHVPLVEGGHPIGVITSTDLMRLERVNAVHIVGDITQQIDVAGVVELAGRVSRLVEQLVGQDVGAQDITRIITSVGDAVERRLLTLAEEELREEGYGPPPRYCWMVLGSRARHEQALGSDQDHAVIIADDAPDEAEDYIAALAERVVAGLAAAGYPRCEGDVMASNPRWRQRLAGWRREFRQWIHEPVPDAVLGVSIFFDSRPLHGDESLHTRLESDIAAWAPHGRNLLAHLTTEALAQEPPLGFFRGFVLARAGEHRDTLDLKRGGVGTIVDIARVHALDAGLVSVNTRARLLAAGHAGAMDRGMAASLVDALEFISHVRLSHQVGQVAAGVPPDSRLRPSGLTAFEQRSLREAFHVVRGAQQALAQRSPRQYYT